MMISYLIQDSVLDETGFGIYAIQGTNFELGETTIVIDISKETINQVGSDIKVDWDSFIQAYNPKVYAEIGAMEGSPSA
jgi:uncharacterized protein (DUF1786 family)